MSFLLAAPEALVTAASDLAGIGSTISTANAVAAAPTTGVLAAAADEVSTRIAALFSGHALGYQQLSAQAAAFHEQFVQALTASASTYAAAEANTAQTLVQVNAPARAVLDHPLIGSATTSAGGGGAAAGGVLSNAVSRVENLFVGNGGAARLLGGAGAAAGKAGAGSLLLGPTGGIKAMTAATPLLQAGSLTNATAAAAASGGGSIGNAIDFLDGTVSFTHGLSNIWGSTTASINQFIQTEINWALRFLPPLPPIP